MRWILSFMLCAAMVSGLCSVARGQDRAHIESLFVKIGDAKNTKEACAELKTLAQQDPDSRQYIANRLPSLIAIAAQGDLQLWISTLELTADLKIAEAVPVLTELLRKDNKGIATSFGAAATLYDDPVAKALSEIGEPAMDSVAGLFQNGDPPTRRRAAIVLSNIGTPNAREAILRQIDREPDPDLKAFMKGKVK
jgi:HEAT repeat protein